MQRPLLVTAFVLLAVSVPLMAQHGGGHASASGHGGFASHASGGHSYSGGTHAFSGTRSSSGFAARPFTRGSTSRQSLSARGFNRPGGVRIRSYGFRNNCNGYGCRGAYGYPWGFDPYWWWDSGSSYDQDQQNQIGLAEEMNQQSLAEQQMREQGDQDAYANSAPPPPHHQEERTEAAPATVLVFRDQHQQQVQNYAIVGETLWIFAPQRTQKIPLSDLDLPATTKANDDRGVDFRLPGAHEGQ